MRRRGVAAGAAAGLMLALGGSAWAVSGAGIVGDEGEIDACYLAQNGQLRVVAAGTECRPSELPLQWSQRGPKGDVGPQGPAGSALHATVVNGAIRAGTATEVIQPRHPSGELSGTYHVVFDRPMTGCTPVAVQQGGDNNGVLTVDTQPQTVGGVLRNDVVTVRVRTRLFQDVPSAWFNLIVAC